MCATLLWQETPFSAMYVMATDIQVGNNVEVCMCEYCEMTYIFPDNDQTKHNKSPLPPPDMDQVKYVHKYY